MWTVCRNGAALAMEHTTMTTLITRANIDAILDSGKLYACMRNGNWWRLRRNGKTQTWKTDATRVRIPVKAGLKSYYAITESDFAERVAPAFSDSELTAPCLDSNTFRHVDDVPAKQGKR